MEGSVRECLGELKFDRNKNGRLVGRPLTFFKFLPGYFVAKTLGGSAVSVLVRATGSFDVDNSLPRRMTEIIPPMVTKNVPSQTKMIKGFLETSMETRSSFAVAGETDGPVNFKAT